MTNKCKCCGMEEQGYGSLLSKDGYCFTCSCRHRNELLEKIDKLEKELSDAKEYCDYSITNRKQLTKQINHWMDKYDQLEKKLEIATKALKDISSWDEYDCMGLAKKALKEMEGVK